jgi:hypothetical protein
MLQTYLRRILVGATLSLLGGAIATGMACTTSPHKVPSGTTGTAGGTATGNASGTAGSSPTGTAGNTTGAAGSNTTGAGGSSTGTAGDTSGAGTAGSTGTGGVTTGTAGTTGGAGGAAGGAAAGTNGAAGTAADNGLHITDAFPIAVTKYWYPSGWDGDMATVAAFTANAAAVIKIDDMSTATMGPCSKRVTGHIGNCFRVTYMPVGADAGATHASVALIPNLPGGNSPNFGDATMAPHVPMGATSITAEVAGDKGAEAVTFNLWDANQGDLFTPTLTADQAWQKITVPLTGVTYDQELSPFGWYSASTTPIVFYYDDVRINNN